MRTILAATTCLLLAACGSSEKTVMQTDEGKLTASDDGSFTVTTKEGATARLEGKGSGPGLAEIASTLPAYAQPYPGATLVSNMTMDDGKGGKGRVVVLETDASMSDVMAFYDKAIASAGVTTQMSVDQTGSAMRGVRLDEAGGTLIAVSDGGDSRTITLTSSVADAEAGKGATALGALQ